MHALRPDRLAVCPFADDKVPVNNYNNKEKMLVKMKVKMCSNLDTGISNSQYN